MKVLIINGPNINMLGIRETKIYGATDYNTLLSRIKDWAKELDIEVEVYQSNHEGCIVDKIQEAYFTSVDGILINPGAYTHTSIAILDALKAVNIPAIEVHISCVDEREQYRQISFVREYCFKTIQGMGIEGYHQALMVIKAHLS